MPCTHRRRFRADARLVLCDGSEIFYSCKKRRYQRIFASIGFSIKIVTIIKKYFVPDAYTIARQVQSSAGGAETDVTEVVSSATEDERDADEHFRSASEAETDADEVYTTASEDGSNVIEIFDV